MNKMRKILLFVLLTSLMASLTGCWDLNELNESSLITGMTLEPGQNHKVRVTVELLNANEAQAHKPGKGGAPSIIQSSEGNTIGEAVTLLNQSVDRTMLSSHIGVIIIDEKLARLGISEHLDTLQRARAVREDVQILISKNTRASDLLKILYPQGTYSSLKLRSQLNSYKKTWGGIANSRLFDLTQALLVEGREAAIGAVTLKGSPKDGENLENVKSVVPKTLVELAGMAVFRDDKLLGFLTAENSRMVVMARNQFLRGTTLSVPLEEKGKYAAIRLFRIKAKMQTTMKNGKPDMRLTLHGEGIIASIDKKEHLDEVAGFRHMEALTSTYVQQQMSTAIDNIQRKYGVDIFGFGEQLFRRHYKQYQEIAGNWNQLFTNSPVTVECNINLLRSELKTDKIEKEE
ncbi:Ger(x)C family spore germination protein [Paenibacillus sp. SI8]|uniref:Ger(x)C family spore germination protein n=1 Tax=unclassified Paenibacillus TaxID=185978 RepID=UPI00346645D4